MAKLRNVSADTLTVPMVGASVGPDEVLTVPDEMFEQYAWPETLWSVVSAKPSKSTTDKEI